MPKTLIGSAIRRFSLRVRNAFYHMLNAYDKGFLTLAQRLSKILQIVKNV